MPGFKRHRQSQSSASEGDHVLPYRQQALTSRDSNSPSISRKTSHGTRKGQKVSLFDNFRTIENEDLYLTGSPFPSRAVEAYFKLEDGIAKRYLHHSNSRSVCHAEVLSFPGRKFTSILYKGGDAHEIWSKDFDFYANVRHPNVLQLFGVGNHPTRPILIFHSELVSLSNFINRCSAIALCYLQHRWILDYARASDYLGCSVQHDELWMQIPSGLLCVGPIGPSVMMHEDAIDIAERCLHGVIETWDPQLCPGDYDDDAKAVQYIEKHFKQEFHEFVGQYCVPSAKDTWDLMDSYKDTYRLGSVLDGSSGKQIASLAFPPNWIYPIHSWDMQLRELLYYDKEELENGFTRFSFQRGGLPFKPFEISCTYSIREPFQNRLRAAWLAQAQYTSIQSQIDPCDCVLLDQICFSFKLAFNHENRLQPGRPLYLFLSHPMHEHDPQDKGIFPSNPYLIPQITNVHHFWSFDPNCESSAIEDGKILQLTTHYVPTISGGSQWKHYQYEAIKQYQQFRDCDPSSCSYAHKHGLPQVEIPPSHAIDDVHQSPQTTLLNGDPDRDLTLGVENLGINSRSPNIQLVVSQNLEDLNDYSSLSVTYREVSVGVEVAASSTLNRLPSPTHGETWAPEPIGVVFDGEFHGLNEETSLLMRMVDVVAPSEEALTDQMGPREELLEYRSLSDDEYDMEQDLKPLL
ncbi:hypothetical protein GYMLUDRAFT_44600 [Collybiopsis luxurians FD-317 M1]|uniref:Protein kinase domain-containing protein n=1 Tax=Collybiopsis luxurians FD-317 M1 TaxID=944289 RepID=A0A0D0BVQ8_9AGAR|nr:hypothetical protein GYMLUDRAFT_44600 [Collybiopsis luxurians FD-317 M1]